LPKLFTGILATGFLEVAQNSHVLLTPAFSQSFVPYSGLSYVHLRTLLRTILYSHFAVIGRGRVARDCLSR